MKYTDFSVELKGGDKMRETYIKPVADIEKFSTVDVLTTSGGDEPIIPPIDWGD